LEQDEIEALVIRRLKNNMNVSSVRKSNLIEITFDNADPVLASRVANTISEEYIRADLDARFTEQQNASQWLNTRLAELQGTLEKSENELQSYREQLGLIATPESSMGGTVRTLEGAGDNLLRARMEAASLRQVYRQVRRGAKNRYEVPEVFNNQAVAAARNLESAARNKYVELQQQLGAAHPQLVAAKNEFESASAAKRAAANAVIQSISKRYEVARSTVAALEKTLESSRENIQEVNRKESQLTVLEREVATNRQIYDAFLTKVKETDATSDFRTPVARIVDPAVPPTDPAKPAKAQLFLLSTLGGLLAGCLLAVSLEAGSNTVRNSDDVEAQLGVPLLATAPIVKGNISETDSNRLIALDPKSPFAESVRTAVIGTKLACIDVEKPVFSFISSMPAEGKSTMACNFAIEQARTSKTVLIEGDMRKPVFTRRFKLNREKPGIAEALQGEPLANCTQLIPDLNLAVIPASKATPTALDLLMSDNLPKMIDELKESFDVIVFDNPPLELVSDGLAVGRHATGVVMVVKSGSTPLPMIKRNVSRIKNAGINIFGIVLNHHDFHRASRYYGEESGQGKYGSSYYYG
jgi:capsular exopolysaccharide synthesis family protein